MAAVVPHLRPELDTSVIKAGQPIRSDTWATLAGLANWCNGHGAMLVPWCYPGHTITSGNTDIFRFYAKPKAQALQRIWVLLLRAASSAGSAEVGAPTGATRTAYTVSVARDRVTPVIFAETLTSSTATAEINIDVKAVGADLTVDAICCYEQTRAELHLDATDSGVAIETLRARQPILDVGNRSLPGVADAYDACDARRACLCAWSVPEAASAFTTSASYQAVFESALMALGPVVDSTAASVAYATYAYVKATGGSVFVQATSAAGSISASTSSTTFTWLSVGNLTVASELLTDPDGLPVAGFDTCLIEIKVGTGTRIDIAGVSVIRTTLPI